MQKFYSLSKLVTAAIAAYDNGTPMNPAGCRGNGSLLTYHETDKQYQGKNVSIGNKIHAASASALVHGVNKALDQGMDVVAATARCMGYQMYVSVRGKRNVESEATKETTTSDQGNGIAVQTSKQENENTHLQQEDDQHEIVSSDPLNNVQQVANETKTSSPNWDYAFSLKKVEFPKVRLKEYALTFGVDLDLRKSFDAMMVHFQAGA